MFTQLLLVFHLQKQFDVLNCLQWLLVLIIIFVNHGIYSINNLGSLYQLFLGYLLTLIFQLLFPHRTSLLFVRMFLLTICTQVFVFPDLIFETCGPCRRFLNLIPYFNFLKPHVGDLSSKVFELQDLSTVSSQLVSNFSVINCRADSVLFILLSTEILMFSFNIVLLPSSTI